MDAAPPPGTLVFVTPRTHSARYVDWYGALWIVDAPCVDDPDFIWCRALATNAVYDWRLDELTIAKGNENAE